MIRWRQYLPVGIDEYLAIGTLLLPLNAEERLKVKAMSKDAETGLYTVRIMKHDGVTPALHLPVAKGCAKPLGAVDIATAAEETVSRWGANCEHV